MNRFKKYAIVLFLLSALLCSKSSRADGDTLCMETAVAEIVLPVSDTIIVPVTVAAAEKEKLQIQPKPDEQKRTKLVSAMLAFPFPFGFMGAHRVMLGCKPWIPVVYVATFGGCFGLLPLIDFCVIVFSKDITPYENNPHIFMWLK